MNATAKFMARQLLSAMLRAGWVIARHGKGSHRVLSKSGFQDFPFAFHDREEVGPHMLAKIAKKTGLTPEDL